MSALSEHYAGKECPGDNDRWRVVENKYSFTIECGRPRPHITIVYGDGPMNNPNYGTKDQAKADAETIAKALNARDMPAAPPEQPAATGPEWHPMTLAPKDTEIIGQDPDGRIFNLRWEPDDCGENWYDVHGDQLAYPVCWMPMPSSASPSPEQPAARVAATPDIVKMYSDMERAKNARIGELEEALGKAVLSAPAVRQLTENERDAIAIAEHQCECSSPSDPEVRFDYEVIRTLLSLIPKEAT